MVYRLLLDENVEREVCDRLSELGHDVEHVGSVAELGKGASDDALARYSRDTGRTILTYDDDFIEETPPECYRATLYFEDETITPAGLAEIVHRMSQVYEYEELSGLQKAGREWLRSGGSRPSSAPSLRTSCCGSRGASGPENALAWPLAPVPDAIAVALVAFGLVMAASVPVRGPGRERARDRRAFARGSIR